ncbi:hypothetical protein INR79_01065 [Vibrio sp. SCSIO 43132]|uniref:hypothetical protein n=1 Tax=Vibrio sp. SCSIO 43132 TaxID=2779363 RepID=UPI001CA89E8E|nr:hypothetical protein [Vibrio sp. SCSIO 43132]UAB70544.1 hypothetical protein INR79_01065 [Vibrio sp. SCSIO 43132]
MKLLKIRKKALIDWLFLVSLSFVLSMLSIGLKYPIDLETYTTLSSLNLLDSIKVFNFIELGSYIFIALVPKVLGLNPEFYLVFLSISIALYITSRIDSFGGRVAFIFMSLGFYGSNLMFSQYKMLLSVFFFIIINEHLFSYKRAGYSKILSLGGFLFHTQSILYTIAAWFRLRWLVVFSIALFFLFKPLLFSLLHYYPDVYVFSKVYTYLSFEVDGLTYFSYIRLFLFLSIFSLSSFFCKKDFYLKCYTFCVLISLAMWPFPIISGRIVSMAFILEALVVYKGRSALIKNVYLIFAVFITGVRYFGQI